MEYPSSAKFQKHFLLFLICLPLRMPQRNMAANQSKSGGTVDYKYGCLLNQKDVQEVYKHGVAHQHSAAECQTRGI